MALLLICVAVLAFVNGANDVSKGVATLVGGGVTRLKTAVIWGALWTMAGGFTAAFAAQGLVGAFSGRGIISPLPEGNAFLIAVAAGALLWVGLATGTGLPVSTTHAITGALIGAGGMAVGLPGIHWAMLAKAFLLPLAISPLISLGLMAGGFPLFHFLFGPLREFCVCLNREATLVATLPPTVALRAPETVVVGQTADCERCVSTVARLNALDALHWLSAGATSFARGLNDAPKILALGLGANLALGFSIATGFLLVAAAMGIGSLAAGFRVTETLARKVTPMAANEGLAANLVTSLVVICATQWSLPVSTTHVSSGAILGLGVRRDIHRINWATVRDILLAWLITVPAAGLFAALMLALTRWFA